MDRVAHCCCGALRAEVSGDPVAVIACHCTECQRRTGSVMAVNAYFRRDQVRVAGESKVFERDAGGGRRTRTFFCPACGARVCSEGDRRPDLVGIAVGAFAEPSFPAPALSFWEQSKHPWVEFGCGMRRMQRQEGFEPSA